MVCHDSWCACRSSRPQLWVTCNTGVALEIPTRYGLSSLSLSRYLWPTPGFVQLIPSRLGKNDVLSPTRVPQKDVLSTYCLGRWIIEDKVKQNNTLYSCILLVCITLSLLYAFSSSHHQYICVVSTYSTTYTLTRSLWCALAAFILPVSWASSWPLCVLSL